MTLNQFRTCIPDDVLAQLEIIDICGAYRDPAIAPELLEICQHVHRISPDASIRIYSNGGLRTPLWWAQVAGIPGIQAIFAIDGLDANHIYRRKVDIDKVLRNAAAFIAAGGRAQWDHIAFAHNEHEIDTARTRANELGFAEFHVKKTARFLRPLYEPAPELRPGDGINAAPIYDRAGAVIGELRPPANERLVNEVLLWACTIEAKAEYYDSFDTCRISCSALNAREIFLSASGHLYPCCWLYVQTTLPTLYRGNATTDPQAHYLLESCGGPASLAANLVLPLRHHGRRILHCSGEQLERGLRGRREAEGDSAVRAMRQLRTFEAVVRNTAMLTSVATAPSPVVVAMYQSGDEGLGYLHHGIASRCSRSARRNRV
ncbi:radical SAM protein [Nocardia sp. NPDC004604]|uniref:radical SAM protein n=1 Tax=Nocardia sp. NPDC004604 TaxID=3157013 RepID=UPI0033A525A1